MFLSLYALLLCNDALFIVYCCEGVGLLCVKIKFWFASSRSNSNIRAGNINQQRLESSQQANELLKQGRCQNGQRRFI